MYIPKCIWITECMYLCRMCWFLKQLWFGETTIEPFGITKSVILSSETKVSAAEHLSNSTLIKNVYTYICMHIHTYKLNILTYCRYIHTFIYTYLLFDITEWVEWFYVKKHVHIKHTCISFYQNFETNYNDEMTQLTFSSDFDTVIHTSIELLH